MKKETFFHIVIPSIEFRFVDKKTTAEFDKDKNFYALAIKIGQLMSSCGISHLFTKEDLSMLIYRLCSEFKCELDGNTILIKEGSIVGDSLRQPSIPIALLIKLLGMITSPWRINSNGKETDGILKAKIDNQLSKLAVFSEELPFNEWKEKFGAAADLYYNEQEVTIPVLYNFENLMAGEYGDFIARHFSYEDSSVTDAMKEVLDEKDLYEPLIYLAWVWANGYITETQPGFYNVDRRIPFNYDIYEGYGDGGISLKQTMLDYNLFALEDFLKDPEQEKLND